MLDTIVTAVACVATIGVVIIAARFDASRVRGLWRGGRALTLNDVAQRYESALAGLVRLTIVVPRIEDPAEDDDLKRAVKNNFAHGVVYTFIVSKDRFETEKTGWLNVFRLYARKALENAGVPAAGITQEVERLVRIVPFREAWDHYPYIFYHCVVGNRKYTLTFRGAERDQGIAKHYVTVGPEEGAVLYSTVRNLVDPAYAHLVADDLREIETEDFESAPARPPADLNLRLVRGDAE